MPSNKKQSQGRSRQCPKLRMPPWMVYEQGYKIDRRSVCQKKTTGHDRQGNTLPFAKGKIVVVALVRFCHLGHSIRGRGFIVRG